MAPSWMRLISSHLGRVVAVAQARDERQVLLLGFFGGFQHAADAGGVDGHRLFAEHVLAGGDGRLQMRRAEVRRRGQDHDVDVGGQQLFIGVKADERVIGDRP